MAGLVLDKVEKILQDHAQNSTELADALVTSRTLQKAKFQARLNYLRDKLATTAQQNQDMHQKRVDVEKKYLK